MHEVEVSGPCFGARINRRTARARKIRRPSLTSDEAFRMMGRHGGKDREGADHGEAGAVRPTDAELAILRVLWRLGPSTVRQVQEALEPSQPTGYTTALKLLQIMAVKGLVDRDESQRSHVYRGGRARTRRRSNWCPT